MSRPVRDAAWAVRAYEAVRARLPDAGRGTEPRHAAGLAGIADRYDAFLLDSFGVLNVGETAIPGAPEAVSAVQRQGKPVLVLTNSASHPPDVALDKYRRLGFDFARDDVISSRDALRIGLAGRSERRWGVMALASSEPEQLGVETIPLGDDPAAYDAGDGFILLGSGEWTEARQRLLADSLRRRPRPVLVGNPDIVAPRETGLTLEPGHYAHRLADELGIVPEFYGKPYANMFDLALCRLEALLGTVSRNRVLMVGDSLHTDVLGGRAAGLDTLLLTEVGLFAGLEASRFWRETGIVPTWVAGRL